MATATTLYQSFDIRLISIAELEPAAMGVAWLRRSGSAHGLDFVAAAQETAASRPSEA